MSSLPGSCGIAFKEWAGVCDALVEGRQTLILRKGGIREEAGSFAPEHRFFWLYPTHVHQTEQGLRPQPAGEKVGSSPGPGDRVWIRALAAVELIHHIDEEQSLPLLESFHVWTTETIRKRFHYRKPGLWVMGVRVFRRDEPWPLLPTPSQLGCKSWVVLNAPLSTEGLLPVLDAERWAHQLERLRSFVGSESRLG
jgi:hypothetical protein